MAEQNSTQAAKLLATPLSKLSPTERGGRSRVMIGTVTAVSAAIADTIFFGRIPAGARITGSWLNNGTGTASSTLALGLRKSSDKTVVAAAGLTAAVSIATAQKVDALTGSLVNAGQSYITPYEVDVYGTIAGAATPASQPICVTVDYVVD